MPQPRKLHDEFFTRAKAEGYLARSAYKLLEIQERHRLIRPDDRVLDLGCAPGSWMQVAAKLVGPRGIVVGVDLTPVTASIGPNVATMVGDAFETSSDALTAPADGPYNVLLSDMAPSTTGHGDDMLSARLCERVLDLAPRVLLPMGNLTMKILEGEDYMDVLNRTRSMFAIAKGLKPRASREVSREMFIIGLNFRASACAPPSGATKPGA